MSTGFIPWTATQQAQQLVQLIQATNSGLTDFTIGSVIRSAIVEPTAIAAQDFGQQIVAVGDQNLQVTLQKALGITPAAARAAYGTVTFTVSTAPTSAVTLPNGFTVAIPGSTLQYLLGASTVWEAGVTTLAVVVTCSVAGTLGNAPANSITQIVSAVPSGLTGLTVTNAQDFTTGANAQTDLDATALVPSRLAQLKAASRDAIASRALAGTVTNPSGYVTEAVSAAVSALGAYVAPAAAAPGLTAISPSTATSLSAGTYTVGITWITANGETPLSPTNTVTVTAGQAITVSALTLPNITQNQPNAAGVNYYLSAAGSTTVLYAGTQSPSETTAVPAFTLTALPASGAAAPPTANTAFAATVGFATCWIANDLGSAPSQALLASAQNWVTGFTDAQGVVHPGGDAAGIITTVVSATLVPQAIVAAILPLPGYTLAMLQDSIQLAIQTVFEGLDIEGGLLYNTLVFAINTVPGVADNLITTPAANLAGSLGVLLTLGTVTLTLMP